MSYSQDQVQGFFDRVNLPQKTREQLKVPGGGQHALEALTTLQQHTMVNIPFENTMLHYSHYQLFPLVAGQLYDKIVSQNQGGLCFQVTRAFMHVIRALGYQCFPTYARINVNAGVNAIPGATEPIFGEWSHMILVVTIDGKRYLVDATFGPNQPTYPVLMRHDVVESDTPGRERRLLFANVPQNSDPDQRYWRVQFRKSPSTENKQSSEWLDSYCFRMDECLMVDFDTVHLSQRHGRRSWFMTKLMAFRWLADEDGKPCGWDMMWENQLRRNWKGKFSLLETFAKDSDRVVALEKYFGIRLDPDEVAQNAGTVAYQRPRRKCRERQQRQQHSR
jgi:arylamine N-acetyltransferase